MDKPKFYYTQLIPVEPENVLKAVYPERIASQLTLEERLPGGTCEDCLGKEWVILPKESLLVVESGKPFIECMSCGYRTHL